MTKGNSNASPEYQVRVLDRLESLGKLSGGEKIALLSGIYAGKVTKLLGVNIDFIAKIRFDL